MSDVAEVVIAGVTPPHPTFFPWHPTFFSTIFSTKPMDESGSSPANKKECWLSFYDVCNTAIYFFWKWKIYLLKGIIPCQVIQGTNVVISGVNIKEKQAKRRRKTCRMWRNVVITGVVISREKYIAWDTISEGTKENMLDVAECR